MDAETKAALGRLRISGCDVVGSHTPSYYVDLLAVARLALAEHPADDDEPAPIKFCHIRGFLIQVSLCDNGNTVLCVNYFKVAKNPTNRQVRRLVAALEGK
jgi:aerobic-type carbon monoxide dehydrogenase small subunit (CoxS/CutS family)